MCPTSEQYEQVCKDEFAEIKDKLDRLDDAIRGNGEPGLKVRIDRLERAEAVRSRLLWIVTGSAVAGAIGMITSAIVQLVRAI